MIGYHPDYDFLESIELKLIQMNMELLQFITKKLLRQMLRIAILFGVIPQVMIIMQSLLKMVNIMAELLLKVF